MQDSPDPSANHDVPTLQTSDNAPRKPGRPASVTRSDIAQAVVRIGFTNASFATVAEALAIAPATLYRHVPSRTELMRMGLEHIVCDSPWPEPQGTWSDQLGAWATASWHLWEQHPGAVGELLAGTIPPTIPALANRIALILTDAGFTVPDAVLAVDLVMDLAADSRHNIEQLHLDPTHGDAARAGELFDTWDRAARQSDDPNAQLPDVGQAMLAAMTVPPIAWFEAKLAVVLAGIEASLAPPATDRHPQPNSPTEDQR